MPEEFRGDEVLVAADCVLEGWFGIIEGGEPRCVKVGLLISW